MKQIYSNNFISLNITSKLIKGKIPEELNNPYKSQKKYKSTTKEKNKIIMQNVFSFFYIKNKFHKYYHTNLKDNNLDKKTELSMRRKTYFDVKVASKYKALNDDIEDENDQIEDQLKRFTVNQ